jgi:hypothetical protein
MKWSPCQTKYCSGFQCDNGTEYVQNMGTALYAIMHNIYKLICYIIVLNW